MTTSKTIAALLGPTLVATATMMLVNLDSMPSLIEELSKSPMLVVLAGYSAFVPGLAIVYFHNRWTGWRTLITVVGWFSLVVGLLRMVFPMQTIAAMASNFSPAMTGILPLIATIFLLIGGFLSFKAYDRE
ncbi:hypothetical protein [Methylocystis sp.]|uniref:hypothetical protein n=1 Tax=Methylocystis sp. TaxID=1911079 RepID=UPI003DA42D46